MKLADRSLTKKQQEDYEAFFKTQTDSSRVKANLVSSYFPQYCSVILKKPQETIWFMDLFSGPGKYEDGNWSTPLLVGELCAKNEALRQKVRFIFNDVLFNKEVEENFTEQFPEGTFKFKPTFRNYNMEEDSKLIQHLKLPPDPAPKAKNPNPTVLFFDPFGYKAVDTATLTNFLRHWGNELFLFANIKRITAALDNDKFHDNVQRLFPTTYAELQQKKRTLPHAYQRTSLIIDTLIKEFKKALGDGLFSSAFKFMEEDSSGASHFILHFTKHHRGYELIKQVFYEWNNTGATLEGDGTFTFDAKALNNGGRAQALFAPNDINLLNLANDLANTFQGKRLSARALFDEHHVKSKYCASQYTQALRKLATDGKLTSIFTDNIEHRYAAYLTEHCILQFI